MLLNIRTKGKFSVSAARREYSLPKKVPVDHENFYVCHWTTRMEMPSSEFALCCD